MAIREYVVKITDEVIPDAFERFENEYSPECEIVRCRDCIHHYNKDNKGRDFPNACDMRDWFVSLDWFCPDGSKKE